jgi:prevent-host-death family protein
VKTINVRDLQQKIRKCIEVAQTERVVVTRHGKPVALVTGVEGYDWEDLYWATNESFWKMIERRRHGKEISFDEMCRRLGVGDPAQGTTRLARRPRRQRGRRREKE